MTLTQSDVKRDVRAYWESSACGERYGVDQDRLRYELEPEIIEFARFPTAEGKRVLEIGVGMGSDFVRWVRAGATASGIDLTARAIEITRARLDSLSLAADLRVADAESLPFDDGSFDIVYSWGVLHHTPRTEEAIAEALRVLAPGGRLRLMLYHRCSWVALAAWARFGLLRGRPLLSLAQAIARVESPGTRAFSTAEIRDLLSPMMSSLDIRSISTHWDRRVAPGLARLTGDRLGWFLLITGVKRR